jgi:hypothetical protein
MNIKSRLSHVMCPSETRTTIPTRTGRPRPQNDERYKKRYQCRRLAWIGSGRRKAISSINHSSGGLQKVLEECARNAPDRSAPDADHRVAPARVRVRPIAPPIGIAGTSLRKPSIHQRVPFHSRSRRNRSSRDTNRIFLTVLSKFSNSEFVNIFPYLLIEYFV